MSNTKSASQWQTKQRHPSSQELRLTFIDSTNGPTAAELAAQQQALDKTRGIDHAHTQDESQNHQ